MTSQSRDETYAKLVRKQKIGMFFAGALIKRRRSLWDRMKVALYKRMVPARDPADDFMRDEIVDAETEFSVEELRAFREGRTR
ncbi:hypothetical protein [Pyruvatibacter mobilis]|jgi:hypothetical protein|uniref:hypothetical protein n=1 Tax=Pyruvatibacter mobilis TaxID=1712261 RepID=UPI003BAC07D5